jgi:nucleotide-binding universal stress UspA family protein
VRVLHVVEPPSLLVVGDMGGYDPDLEVVWEEETKQAKVLVEKTAETLRSHGMKVTTSVQQGDSQSTIIDASEEWYADLIVMGSHRRDALSRFLMGSVSQAIACHARCSVEIVRIPPACRGVSVRSSEEFTLAVPECAVMEHSA